MFPRNYIVLALCKYPKSKPQSLCKRSQITLLQHLLVSVISYLENDIKLVQGERAKYVACLSVCNVVCIQLLIYVIQYNPLKKKPYYNRERPFTTTKIISNLGCRAIESKWSTERETFLLIKFCLWLQGFPNFGDSCAGGLLGGLWSVPSTQFEVHEFCFKSNH